MIFQLRKAAGWVAIWAYVIMGAVLYFRVLPGADWLWPPDFHLTGYDAQSVAPFLDAISGPAQDAYVRVLSLYDRVFIVALAVWIGAVAWRGSGFRYFVIFLAALYGVVDLAENAALLRIMASDGALDSLVRAAHHLTMAKFAALYLCGLVLFVHVRRSV